MDKREKVCFLCCAYSDNNKSLFFNNSKRGYQYAAQNYQEAIIEGLLQNDVDIKVLSIPSLSTFPRGCSLYYVKRTPFVYNQQVIGVSMGFVNLPFINNPSLNSQIKELKSLIGIKSESTIIVYGLHRKLMLPALKLKKINPKVKIIIIAPDFPEYMAVNKYYKRLGLYKRDVKYIYDNIKFFDGVVVLSKYMLEKINCPHMPAIVIEGIYNEIIEEKYPKEDNKIILYTGGINARYGIIDLLESFSNIDKDNYRLWICGKGDCEEIIQDYCLKDKRIVYKGAVSKETALKYQKQATLLVNPRHGNELFTRYSFPSKTMEYLASGTPTLMCKLDCIPEEYYEYLYFFDDESIEGMKNKMIEVCEIPSNILMEKGRIARDFIINHKNPQKQVGKILSMLR